MRQRPGWRLVRGAAISLAIAVCALQAAPASADEPKSPAGSPHWVRRGETLFRISKIYGIPVEAICRANGIRSSATLKAGTILTIPVPGIPVSPVPTTARQPRRAASGPAGDSNRRADASRAAGRAAGKIQDPPPAAKAPAPSRPIDPVGARMPQAAEIPSSPGPVPAPAAAAAASSPLGPIVSRDQARRTAPSPPTASATLAPVQAGMVGPLPEAAPGDRTAVKSTGGESSRRDGHYATWSEEDEGPSGTPSRAAEPGRPEASFLWPIQGGAIYSPFGKRHSRFHAGVDIAAPWGTLVYAAREGTVVYSGRKLRGYGNVVIIDHGDGYRTLYAHNSKNLVRAGDHVEAGQVIARVGATGNATGNHCHFEIREENVALDPATFLPTPDALLRATKAPDPARPPAQINKASILPIP